MRHFGLWGLCTRRPEFACAVHHAICTLFDGTPAPDEQQRVRSVDHVEVRGSVAIATMTLDHGAVVFTDMFVLMNGPAGWRIANKVYHRHE